MPRTYDLLPDSSSLTVAVFEGRKGPAEAHTTKLYPPKEERRKPWMRRRKTATGIPPPEESDNPNDFNYKVSALTVKRDKRSKSTWWGNRVKSSSLDGMALLRYDTTTQQFFLHQDLEQYSFKPELKKRKKVPTARTGDPDVMTKIKDKKTAQKLSSVLGIDEASKGDEDDKFDDYQFQERGAKIDMDFLNEHKLDGGQITARKKKKKSTESRGEERRPDFDETKSDDDADDQKEDYAKDIGGESDYSDDFEDQLAGLEFNAMDTKAIEKFEKQEDAVFDDDDESDSLSEFDDSDDGNDTDPDSRPRSKPRKKRPASSNKGKSSKRRKIDVMLLLKSAFRQKKQWGIRELVDRLLADGATKDDINPDKLRPMLNQLCDFNKKDNVLEVKPSVFS